MGLGQEGPCAAAVTAIPCCHCQPSSRGDELCVLGGVSGLGGVVTQEDLSDLCSLVLNEWRFS